MNPIERTEVIHNGRVVAVEPGPGGKEGRVYRHVVRVQVHVASSGWIAVRALAVRGGGRVRFAHSAPVHVKVRGKRVEPNPQDVHYLISLVREELARSSEVLRPEALAEYEQALRYYESWKKEPRR